MLHFSWSTTASTLVASFFENEVHSFICADKMSTEEGVGGDARLNVEIFEYSVENTILFIRHYISFVVGVDC